MKIVFALWKHSSLFVISDGMGGEAHGEIASAMAVETVVKSCMDEQKDSVAAVDKRSSRAGARKPGKLFNAAHLANKKIFESPKRTPNNKAWAPR